VCPLCQRQRCYSAIQCAFISMYAALRDGGFARSRGLSASLRKRGVLVLSCPTYCTRTKGGWVFIPTQWAPAAAVLCLRKQLVLPERLPPRPPAYAAALRRLYEEVTVRTLGGHLFVLAGNDSPPPLDERDLSWE